MKKFLSKYNGAILLYSVIIIGVFALNERFKYLNEIELQKDNQLMMVEGD